MPSMARLTDSGCSDYTVCLPHWLSAATNAIQADVSSSRCRLAVVGFNISGYPHIEKLGEKPPSGQATSLAHIFFTSMYVCVCEWVPDVERTRSHLPILSLHRLAVAIRGRAGLGPPARTGRMAM